VAAPDYVPVSLNELPRVTEPIPAAGHWRADRPGDLKGRQPVGPRLGRPGPDQGYALRLAHRFEDRLELTPTEDKDDAIAGCLGVATKRASIFGRAPVIWDLELAFTLWGFLGGAPEELIAFRLPLFESAKHDYEAQRDIADRVPEDTLRMKPEDIRHGLPAWRGLIQT
jgi:hypothetical protein